MAGLKLQQFLSLVEAVRRVLGLDRAGKREASVLASVEQQRQQHAQFLDAA